MKKLHLSKLAVMMIALVMLLTACSSADKSTETPDPATPTTVEITDIHGVVTVPVNPKNVVSLDNRTFETLSAWGVKLVAVPKGVMPADSSYVKDTTVQDIGDHREPNLEVLAAANPDLVIVGQRFAGYYDEIKKLVPNAAVIDLNFDVSETAANSGENLINGFKSTTAALGKIFEKTAEADKLIADLDTSIAAAKKAYNGTDKIMSVIVSGGTIGFSAPKSGRVWGPLYEVFNWTPALTVDGSTSDHQGDEVSVEAIAKSNPDWIFVLDRDASIASSTDAVPAKDVIANSPALQNVTAVTKNQVVYAPANTYTNESIQTFITIFNDIAAALSR